MGYTASEARGHLRLTLGSSSTDEDVDTLLARLPGIVERLRALSTRPTSAR
jgi:cysteine desulfurase